MNKFLTVLIAGTFAFAAASVMADDKTPTTTSAADQAKLKSDASMKKADNAKMTKEEKAAAKKTRNASKQAELKTTEKIGDTGALDRSATNGTGSKMNTGTKADPKPMKGNSVQTPAASTTPNAANKAQ